MNKYVQVMVPLPVEGPFTYKVPKELMNDVDIGKRVLIPFGSRKIIGYITDLTDTTDVTKIKNIIGILDRYSLINRELLVLTKWIANYYACSWGEAINAVIPASIRNRKKLDYTAYIVAEKRAQQNKYNHLTPTFQQNTALKHIADDINNKRFESFLLHGITGSGKTEVYLQTIDMALMYGRSSIMLIPEISLTAQTVERFVSRFGSRVAILHSKLTSAQRNKEWLRIKKGEADIVIGARSAVFAPIDNLGLVIVDEEHETTYKQEDVPRYNAVDVAIQRAKLSDAVVILGSATPSLESYYKAKKGEYRLIELSERIKSAKLPAVQIVDMRDEVLYQKGVKIFSRVLIKNINETIENKQQAILFLNRRGFSTYINCRKCGFIMKCEHCSIALTYHFDRKNLICHHCNYETASPELCPECKGAYIKYYGIGTQKVESEIKKLFPNAKVGRIDTDVTAKKGAQDKILSQFKKNKIDILVGTQMIAKGLDFPKVTLVGVIAADVTLNIPDFRSAERTFNLITQVAGRAGRSKLGGKVIVQTYTPDNYAVRFACKHDYAGFYNEEIKFRKELNFPPFINLCSILIRGRDKEKVFAKAKDLADYLKKDFNKNWAEIMGPVPSPIEKLRNQYRCNIFIKLNYVNNTITELMHKIRSFKKTKGIIVTLDVDPK